VQRVQRAEVSADGASLGRIGRGLVVLLGVGRDDTPRDADALAEKLSVLRVFDDAAGKMNLSVADVAGEVLVVSQFTLWADCRRGRRPSFERAAPADQARTLYERFIATLRAGGASVAEGRFQARMAVELVNDGPVTLLLDTAEHR